MTWIIRRARQFVRALTAKVSTADRKYIARHLSDAEQELFFAMSKVDQAHSLKVARRIEELSGGDVFMVRCGLLHDVGRVAGDLSIAQKVIAVLLMNFAPNFGRRLQLHALHVYENHPKIGAAKLQRLGLFEEAKIISKHHAKNQPNDPRALKLLRLADEEN